MQPGRTRTWDETLNTLGCKFVRCDPFVVKYACLVASNGHKILRSVQSMKSCFQHYVHSIYPHVTVYHWTAHMNAVPPCIVKGMEGVCRYARCRAAFLQ